MGLTLIVLNGPGKGRVFELDGRQPELIGRAAPRLRVSDSETSRRHAEIRYEKDTWIIRDLGSTNGTYVNGRRLTGLTELEEGDQLLIGRVMMVVGQILPAGEAARDAGQDSRGGQAAGAAAAVGAAAAEAVEIPGAVDADADEDDIDFGALDEAADDAAGLSEASAAGVSNDASAGDEASSMPIDDAVAEVADHVEVAGAPAEASDIAEEVVATGERVDALADAEDAVVDSVADGPPSIDASGAGASVEGERAAEADDHDFDPSELEGFDFGGRSEDDVAPEPRPATEEPTPAAGLDAEVTSTSPSGGGGEAGFLSSNASIMADAAEAVRREREELALDSSSPSEVAPPPEVEARPEAPPAAPPETPVETRVDAAPAEAEEDPLAALASRNLAAGDDDEWADFALDLDEPDDAAESSDAEEPAPTAPADDERADRSSAAAAAAVPADDEDDGGFIFSLDDDEEDEGEVDDGPLSAAVEDGASPAVSPAAAGSASTDASAKPHPDALADTEPDPDAGDGTGLLHHVGLRDDGLASAADDEDAGLLDDDLSLDHEDEVEGDLVAEHDDADDRAQPQPAGESPITGLYDDHASVAADADDDEQGVDLASIVPAQPTDDERPTTIISEAVQTHAPYHEGDPLSAINRRAGAPRESVPAEQWLSPERRRQLDREAGERAAAVAAAGDADVPFASRRRRRGLVAVLLSILLIGLGASGWVAFDRGYLDLSQVWPEPTPLAVAPPDPTQTGRTTTSPTPPPTTASPTTRPATIPAAGPAARPWLLGEAPPDAALTEAPPLLGEAVLAGRVLHDTPAPGTSGTAPQAPADVAPEANLDAAAPAGPRVAAAQPAPGEPALADTTFATPDTDAPDTASTQASSAVPRPPASGEPADPVTAPGASNTPGVGADTSGGESGGASGGASGGGVAPRRIAFVVNGSGSVLDTITQIVAWKNAAVAQLSDRDRFTVIFFRRGQAIEVPPVGLRPADDNAKAAVRAWTDITEGNVFPTGQSDPLAAIARAIELEVTEIILLSDDSIGRGLTGDEVEETLDLLGELVADRALRIHTVQFFYRDPQDMMRRLAERFDGTYQFVRSDNNPGPDPIEALSNLTAIPSQPPPAP